MDTISSSTHDNLGCRQANALNNATNSPHVVVALVYGDPRYFQLADGSYRYGATAYGTSPVSVGQIATAVENFVNGFARCLADRNASVDLAFGVTNHAGATMNPIGLGLGQAWASGVKLVDDYIYGHGYSGFMRAYGAGDLELEYNDAAHTRGFVDGFNSPTFEPLKVLGDSTGCPSTLSTANCGGGGFSWTQTDVHYINYGAAPSSSIPQNYNTSGTTAKQRYVLAKNKGTKYQGTVTQYAACLQRGGCSGVNNTPQQGFRLLDDQLNSDAATATTLYYATDLKYCDSNGGIC
ncbi:MAG: hypothetical protein H0V22_00695 [Solirubrobacterales bacterium]|nr:hypothetical protein [Solirubrobacterales bacterium]